MEKVLNDPRSMALKILFATEAVVALRALLFVTPAFISRLSSQGSSVSAKEDQGIIFLAIVAIVYLVTGIVSLIKEQIGRVLHVVSLGVAALCYVVVLKGSVSSDHFMLSGALAALLLMITLTALFLKNEPKTSS